MIISSFVAGLKEYIQNHLQCHRPHSLLESYWIAKRLETAYPGNKKFSSFTPVVKTSKTWTHDKETKPISRTIQELQEQGKCFKCREPWIPGHAKVCKGKKWFSLLVVNDEEDKETDQIIDDKYEKEQPEDKPLQLSTHALQGIDTKAQTFVLLVHVGDQIATALVDTGSDASFINAKFAVKAIYRISTVSKVQVVASNGKLMDSTTACRGCRYTIQG